MNLVFIPFHDWKKCEREGFRTRDAHFMQEFGKHPLVERLLVVNRPVSFAERLLKRQKQPHDMVQQVGEKTYTIDTVLSDWWQPILKRRRWIPEAYGRQKTFTTVQQALQKLGISNYTVFTNAPIYVPLVKQLQPQIFIFDMTDNLLKHASYRTMPHIKEYYEYCIDHAAIITANSPDNTDWLKKKRPDTLYIPNGVDISRFDPDRLYSPPEDIKDIPHPIVGFAGKMQEMIDVELMVKTVEATPRTHYVFIGQQLDSRHMARLWQYPTVHYLGDKHYDELPGYLASFDICIIPYHINRQHGVDPIKFYEYTAMGKPVVTTNIGGVSAFKNYSQIIIANTEAMFINGVKSFVEKIERGETIAKTNLPVECFWNTKADDLLQLIQSKI